MSFVHTTIIDGTAATIAEAAEEGSRTYTSGDNPSASVRFYGTGYDDTSAAYLAINALLYTTNPIAPFTRGPDAKPRFHGLPVTSITVTRRVNAKLYDIVVNCSAPNFSNSAGQNNNPEPDIITNPEYNIPAVEPLDWNYSSSLSSSHVEVALSKIASARYDNTTPIDFGLVIGPNSDGTYQGADRASPASAFSITRSEPPGYLDATRRVALANLTGSINASEWAGYAARCVMFTGFNAQTAWLEWTDGNNQTQKFRYWRVTYTFEARPWATMTVGNTTLTIAGYDTVSRCDQSLTYASSGTTIWQPEQVDQLCLYPQRDFQTIGLVFAQ